MYPCVCVCVLVCVCLCACMQVPVHVYVCTYIKNVFVFMCLYGILTCVLIYVCVTIR